MIGRINLALATVFRKMFGRKMGKITYFVFWFFIFDIFIRPFILKFNLVLNRIISIPNERVLYLENVSKSDPMSLNFWFDPYLLPIVIVVIVAYLLPFFVPVALTFQVRNIFKS